LESILPEGASQSGRRRKRETAEATSESWIENPDNGIAVFPDRSKVMDGWIDRAAVWNLTGSDGWQGRKRFTGRSEVFDAELYAI
jgi:hypothetical protein